MVKVFRSASQITDAHSCGNSLSVNFAETFNLNATGKRGKRVGRQIERRRKETDCNQDQGFCKDRNLSPVKQVRFFCTDRVCQCDSQCKSKYREEVIKHGLIVSLRKIYTKKEEAAAGMSLKEFFPVLREGKSDNLNAIWQDYLKHLAFAMRNLNMIIDSPIIISGYLAPYLVPEDLNMLLHLINENNPFTLTADQLLVGTHGQYTPAIGAALHYINRFVHEGTAL